MIILLIRLLLAEKITKLVMRDVEDERGDIVEEEDSSSPGKISAEQEAVDWCFHLKDASLAYNYTQFKIASTPCTYAIITATALTAYLLFYWTLVLTQHPDSFTISTAVITFIFAVIPLWVICAMRLQFLTSHEESEQPKHSRIGVWLRYLESFTALGFILAFSLMHIMRVSNGGCHATDYLHVFHCLPIYKCSSIFSETLQMLLMIPLLFCIIFPYVSYLLIVTCYILAVLVLIATSIAANAAMSITWNLSTILFFAIILYVYQRQHLQLFFYIQRYQGIVGARERDRRTRATKLAQETRNMIANISHDLKSVSNFYHTFPFVQTNPFLLCSH